MKNFISGIICGAILFSAISMANEIVAVISSQKIMLDGNKADVTAYNINGNNYFKLRDLGQLFDFNVSWDGELNSIIINTAESYDPTT